MSGLQFPAVDIDIPFQTRAELSRPFGASEPEWHDFHRSNAKYQIKYANYCRNHDTYDRYIILKDGQKMVDLQRRQYPACCGLSVLSHFYSTEDFTLAEYEEAMTEFMERIHYDWNPEVQFVAVKEEITEEVYDEEYDEWNDKHDGHQEDYDYPLFINGLIAATKSEKISEFINANSHNICSVFQFTNRKLESLT